MRWRKGVGDLSACKWLQTSGRDGIDRGAKAAGAVRRSEHAPAHPNKVAQARKGENTIHPGLVFQERTQSSTAAGMPQFFERFDLDLTNTLTTQVEPFADFLQGVHGLAADAESHAQDLFFARGERAEDSGDIMSQILIQDEVQWRSKSGVLDEVRKLTVTVSHRRFQGDRFIHDGEDLPHLIGWKIKATTQFLRRRFAFHDLDEFVSDTIDATERLRHMHGDPYRAHLLCNRPGDRLTDPPTGIGTELIAAPIIELLDRLHQTDVPFLDEVQQG